MPRRGIAGVVMALVAAVGGAAGARADQATLVDGIPAIAPGEAVKLALRLVVVGAGIPNVVYDNGDSFVVGETVTATITPIVEPAGFGTVERLDSGTLTGTAPDDWNTGEYGEFGEIHFDPELTLLYTAPSLSDLGCPQHPGEAFYGHVGVSADFVGDAGTIAHVDPLLGGQGWVGAAVPVTVRCPQAESTLDPMDPANPTPPPTDTLPAAAAPRGDGTVWALLALVALGGLAVAARRRPA